MTNRSFEEIKVDVDQAFATHDAKALLRYAAELDAISTPQAEATASSSRGLVHELRGDNSTAMIHYHRALALHEELGERTGMARATGNIGAVHQFTGDYPEALSHFHRALALHEELGNRNDLAGVTGNIGSVHLSTGDYPEALSHYHRALALHEELGDRGGVARVSGNIGNVHASTGDYPAALSHYHRALALHEELGDRSGVASVTGNIGNIHYSTGDYPAALSHYHRARALHEELGERSVVARVSGNIVAACLEMGSDAEAQALLQTMDVMQIDDPTVRIEREQHRAALQERRGDLDGATATLQRALAEASEHGLRAKAAEVHKALRDLALKQNNLAGYVEHNNEFTRITEEINGKESTLKMAMQAKQREIDAERKEHEKQIAVLHSTLPKHIADRIARGETVNDHYDSAAVIFLDIVGFTTISDRIPSGHVVHLLDQIFTTLDAVCKRHDVIKIKTIGDSYMAVSFDSVTSAASCALDMLSSLDALVITMPPALGDTSWTKDIGDIKVRIGMHCGPVTAGVIGTERMQYDVWGDTVNVASRMESSGEAGRVHISEAFAALLPATSSGDSDKRPLQAIERGTIDVKGKGMMKTYWLE